MRHLLPLIALPLAAACMSGPPSPQAQAAAADRQSEIDAELAQELAGKVAGTPVSCISTSRVRSSKNVGDQTLLYEVSANLVYRNDPVGGCSGLQYGRTLITRTPSTQLCAGDIARVADLQTGMETGSCAFSEWVPYRTAQGG